VPYKIYRTENLIQKLNPYPLRLGSPFYCALDSSVINGIAYDVVPEETLTNYCEFAVEQEIEIYEVNPPSFLSDSATTALWLDADDSSTITLVSGSVSEWRDKSGNTRHASQGTAINRPVMTTLEGKDVLSFDGSNDFLESTATINLTSGFTFFYVCQMTTRKNFNGIFRVHSEITTASSDLEIYYQAGTSGSGNLVSAANRGGSFRGSQSDDAPPNTGQLFQASIIHINSTTVERIINADNPLVVSFSFGTGSFLPANSNKYYVGVGYGDTPRFGGLFAEIIAIPSVLSQANRELVEGYLAHKWGLVANLPSGHPYKNDYPDKILIGTETVSIYDFDQAP
jgi:hypothetical protein